MKRDKFPFKVYLENTTKVPRGEVHLGYLPGTVDFIYNYLITNPQVLNLFGMCVDTEHDYAVQAGFLEQLDYQVDTIFHVNPIPKEVLPGSYKDAHSFTTLFECSVNKFEFYKDLIEKLNKLKVPYIRECKHEVMLREWEQLKVYNNER